jgi:hypothetical protein
MGQGQTGSPDGSQGLVVSVNNASGRAQRRSQRWDGLGLGESRPCGYSENAELGGAGVRAWERQGGGGPRGTVGGRTYDPARDSFYALHRRESRATACFV